MCVRRIRLALSWGAAMGDADRALLSLIGLSVGDAFGEQFFGRDWSAIERRQLPPGPWRWTDDTHMALSIVEHLIDRGEIVPDQLARLFAHRFDRDPDRGYGAGAVRLLVRLGEGMDWREVSQGLFNGGSYGNGAAMRAAPIGGYFWGDPERAAAEARKSAEITHAHPEGQAGAMAVAAAAALSLMRPALSGPEYWRAVLEHVPAGRTREGVAEATKIGPEDHPRAASVLGTGQQLAAFDTVPFCLWVVANHGFEYELALWTTVAGRGDLDTTCAIVGGIVALAAEVPADWVDRREPLPDDFPHPA